MPGRLRILIVDDDHLVTATLAAMLREIGVSAIATAATYRDGLALIDGVHQDGAHQDGAQRDGARPCDLAFIDLHLDGRASGIDLARRAANAGLPVVVMTGSASLPSELSGVGLLLKPFSSAQVATIIHALRVDRGTA